MIRTMANEATVQIYNTPVTREKVMQTALSMASRPLPAGQSFVAAVLHACGGEYLFPWFDMDGTSDDIHRFAARKAMRVPPASVGYGNIIFDGDVEGFVLSCGDGGYRIVTQNGILDAPPSAAQDIFLPEYADTLICPHPAQLPVDSMLVYDLTEQRCMFSKNTNKRLYTASIVKLLSAIVVYERFPDLTAVQTEFDIEMLRDLQRRDASLTALTDWPSRPWSAEVLLYGMLLPSGCECAHQLARLVCDGDEERFVGLMNELAARLGCTDTLCTDASGLDRGAYSTAEDILKIFRYFVQIPYLRQVLSTVYAKLEGMRSPFMTTGWIGNAPSGGIRYFPYYVCGKTGTGEGLHHVGLFRRNGREYISILLRYTQEATLYRAAYYLRLQHALFGYVFASEGEYMRLRLRRNYVEAMPGEQFAIGVALLGGNVSAKRALTLTSSNPAVAEVTHDGKIRVLARGSTVIKVRSETGDFDCCLVNAGDAFPDLLRTED